MNTESHPVFALWRTWQKNHNSKVPFKEWCGYTLTFNPYGKAIRSYHESLRSPKRVTVLLPGCLLGALARFAMQDEPLAETIRRAIEGGTNEYRPLSHHQFITSNCGVVEISDGVYNLTQRFIEENQVIEAIRYIRVQTGLDLRNSLDIVNSMRGIPLKDVG